MIASHSNARAVVNKDRHLSDEMLRHMTSVVGWERLGLGSDLDGGFGAHEFPEGIDSATDLHLLGEVVPAQVRAGVLGGHWARWLTQEWGR